MKCLVTIGLSAHCILLLLFTNASAGSLYRCVTDTAGTIYTDNPAQLEQCAPITASGAVTSLATVSSGGPPISVQADPFPMTPTPPGSTLMMPSPGSLDQPIAEIPQNPAPNTPPCPMGINPLNPLSAPPCPTDDAVPPAPVNMPNPGAAPAFPAQP